MVGGEIRVLDPVVINQIAAGEVVERPASVVKELVENSLDAGARQITVEIEGGGKRLIRVIDDGHGMTPEGLRLALERHATSKLRRLDDLLGLATMGFRGEALPAIASVSRMTVTTRARGGRDPAARQLEIEGGRIVAEREVGAPPGTRIEVRDLLFNVPARQKFMKAEATESAHVIDWVSRLALANPAVHIRLRQSGRGGTRTTLDAPRTGDCYERACAILGARVGGRLHRGSGAGGGVRVEAYLAGPEHAQSSSRGLQLFVSRRSVRDRGLLHAVAAGYGELIARGRFATGVVLIEVPDAELDVNVHPQKLEVRFADPQVVYAVVRGTVRRAVADAGWLPAAEGPSGGPASRAAERLADYAARRRQLVSPASLEIAPPESAREPPPPMTLPRTRSGSLPARGARLVPAPRLEPQPPLRYLGQLDRSTLVCEDAGELVLVDQHAAHQRVLAARLLELHRSGAVPAQRLLFPEKVSLDPERGAAVLAARAWLAGVGLEVEAGLPPGEVALRTVPAAVRRGSPAALLRELAGALASGPGAGPEVAISLIACHSAIAPGDPLSPREAIEIIAGLSAAPGPPTCDHDRATTIRIAGEEIDRRFRGVG
jgi:DNA mismatch repair protein MutL